MVSPEDAFVVIAELSLALAGFAGVVSAFGGRGREFNRVERMRLGIIFWSSGSVLVGSLFLFVVSAAGLSAETAYKAVGLSLAVAQIGRAAQTAPVAMTNLRDANTTISMRSYSFAYAIVLLTMGLYVTAVWLGGEAWPLMAGLSLLLILGLLVFARLLTSPT